MPRAKGGRVRDSVPENEGRRCEVTGCAYPRRGLSRYCRRHKDVECRTGDPLGRTVTLREVKPFYTAADDFVFRNADHPAIAAALTWIKDLLAGAYRPGYRATSGHDHDVEASLDAWLCRARAHGVTPQQILTMTVAVLWHERTTAWRYPSLRFRNCQLANRVLRLCPGIYRPNTLASGAVAMHATAGRHSIRLRDYWGRRLVSVLGVLAVKIADAIEAQPPPEDVLRDPERLPGISEPFTT